MPHSYKLGTDIEPHIHWTLEDATDCNSVMKVTCDWASISADFGTDYTASSTCASNANAARHNLCDLGMFDGTGKGLSSILVCEVRRRSSLATDTCNSKDVYLHEFDFHFEKDTIGSRMEVAK